MSILPAALGADALQFLTERHLATFTSLLADGRPHVVPVGFTWDVTTATARIITSAGSQKARNAGRGGPVVLCQVDGARWLSLVGTALVLADPASVADGEQRYARRYRPPRVNPSRIVVRVDVTRVLGSSRLLA